MAVPNEQSAMVRATTWVTRSEDLAEKRRGALDAAGQVSWRDMGAFKKQQKDWESMQTFMLLGWANYQLERFGYDPMESLEDLHDGIRLRDLLMAVSEKEVKGKFAEKPKIQVQRVSNLTLAFDFIKAEGINLVNIGPVDIERKNEHSLLGLVWSLIQHYLIDMPRPRAVQEEVKSDPEEEILLWAFARSAPFGMQQQDMKAWIADGRLFGAVVASISPAFLFHEIIEQDHPYKNIESSLNHAKQVLNVPKLIVLPSGCENATTADISRQVLITQLAVLRDRLENPENFIRREKPQLMRQTPLRKLNALKLSSSMGPEDVAEVLEGGEESSGDESGEEEWQEVDIVPPPEPIDQGEIDSEDESEGEEEETDPLPTPASPPKASKPALSRNAPLKPEAVKAEVPAAHPPAKAMVRSETMKMRGQSIRFVTNVSEEMDKIKQEAGEDWKDGAMGPDLRSDLARRKALLDRIRFDICYTETQVQVRHTTNIIVKMFDNFTQTRIRKVPNEVLDTVEIVFTSPHTLTFRLEILGRPHRRDGSYVMEWAPKTSGLYSANVVCNNCEVQSHPCHIRVSKRRVINVGQSLQKLAQGESQKAVPESNVVDDEPAARHGRVKKAKKRKMKNPLGEAQKDSLITPGEVVLIEVAAGESGKSLGYLSALPNGKYSIVQNSDVQAIVADPSFLFRQYTRVFIGKKLEEKGSAERFMGFQNLKTSMFISRPHFGVTVTSGTSLRDHETISTCSSQWQVFKNGLKDAASFYVGKNDRLCVGKTENPLKFFQVAAHSVVT